MADTCNRFVAYLDIMGFKDMILRKKADEIINMFESLQPTMKKIKMHAKQWTRNSWPSISLLSFSDSIILVSSNDSIPSAAIILSNVEEILSAAIEAKIPIKGAIAHGEMTTEIKREWPIYFGQPLIDAYELQNELNFYGVALHHTIEQFLKNIKMIGTTNDVPSIFLYPVPMKKGNINHYIIDWTFSINKNKDPLELVAKLYNSVSGEPRKYVDNTLEFVNQSLVRKSKLKNNSNTT